MYPSNEFPKARLVIVEWERSGGVSVWPPKIKYVNAAATELLGFDEKELADKSFHVLCPESEEQPWRQIFSQAVETGADQYVIAGVATRANRLIKAQLSLSRLVMKDPERFNILILIQEFNGKQLAEIDGMDEPGIAGMGVNVCRDVESALVESEERFRQMAEMTGEWLWEQDPGGFYIYCSAAVYQILGFSPEQVVGKHYTEFLTAQDKAEQLFYAASHEPFYSLINHYQHKDGHPVITESTGLPIIDAAGKLLKWRGVDRDITAKKQFEDALIESEKRIRMIIESALNAIVIMDSYGIIRDWNRQAEQIFGWRRDEAIGRRLDELIIPERFRKAHRLGLDNFLRGGNGSILNRVIEQPALRQNGSEFPIELSISPLRVGNAFIFSGFIHDISARKAAEQQIRQAQVKLAIARNEIDIARKIQATLSPSTPIKNVHFEVTGRCLSADQVGGDYYDYFYRGGHHLDMVIADVSGHSIGPALFMVETRSAIRANAGGAESPAPILELLNRFLFEDLNRSDFFITLFYLQYDIDNRLIRYANAGHPPPLLYQRRRNACRRLDADGLIVGVHRQVHFEEKSLPMEPGDIILFYTDGLTEAESDQDNFFGIDRLENLLLDHCQDASDTMIIAILDGLKQFCRTDSFKDDITLMVFKCL
ncbi:PAS domain S-box protein [Methylomicrobium sp. Wu6]|uniref:PAS domain S-box protein n=1 Tax=Methylomicrobium sp. Wu6 TaxID=3107928 RepID=UPI002DD6725D|nr:PAS domain S-box protein [Methylomicrobium sp. Wu6]MEC4748271.1 PAS domain S-box protein [Methylomicrobium sp. Wu6]